MKKLSSVLGCALLLVAVISGAGAAAPDDAMDAILGVPGKSLPGGVRRYGWPRRDLAVTLGGVKLEPALALGSWGSFLTLNDGNAMTMGDLVLLEEEVAPVVTALQSVGLDVLAIHNHLLAERPPLAYVHFGGHGEPLALAKALRAALAKTRTPIGGAAAAAEPSETERAVLARVERALGRTGTTAGRVLQLGVPRAGKIEEHGVEIPPSMGMAIAMNFQVQDAKVATTGDFVLVASEVNPVIRALQAGGLAPTALHSHMLEESPRLFFLHFWGVDTPEKVGAALASALSKIDVKR